MNRKQPREKFIKDSLSKKQLIENITSGTCARLLAALPCQQYQIFTLPPTGKREIVPQNEFKFKILGINANHLVYEHIFFRPDDCRYILIDDLTHSNLDELKKVHKVNAVVETSPDNYQAWLYIDVPNPDPIKCENVQRDLTKRFNGDIRSNGQNRLGRVPETRNKKPEYKMSNGFYPFSKLRFPTNRKQILLPHDNLLVEQYNIVPSTDYEEPDMEFSKNIVGEPQADSVNVSVLQPTSRFSSDDFYIEAIKEMKYRLKGHKFDRSYIDCAISCTMFAKGYSKSDIRNTLLKLSEKAQERTNKEGYIISIIKALTSKVQLLEFNFLN